MCQVPSTSLQRQKEEKHEPLHLTCIVLVSHHSHREFNNATINSIHVSPVTVITETAIPLLPWISLYVFTFVNIRKVHITKIIVLQQIKIAFIIMNSGEKNLCLLSKCTLGRN